MDFQLGWKSGKLQLTKTSSVVSLAQVLSLSLFSWQEVPNKCWTSHAQFLNKSRTCHKHIMIKFWTSPEQIMGKLWKNLYLVLPDFIITLLILTSACNFWIMANSLKLSRYFVLDETFNQSLVWCFGAVGCCTLAGWVRPVIRGAQIRTTFFFWPLDFRVTGLMGCTRWI